MKDFLREILDNQPAGARRSVLREYLQARVLQALQDQKVFTTWALVGGTALRFLFHIPRYSEDLDFSLPTPSQSLEFRSVIDRVAAVFGAEGYEIGIKAGVTAAVAGAFIRFRGLLHELELSPYPDETISVKVEIDTNPPAGAGTTTTVIRRHVTVRLMHHDRQSLFAGKLHAVLTRQYTKGRDLYDLAWYLADLQTQLDLLATRS